MFFGEEIKQIKTTSRMKGRVVISAAADGKAPSGLVAGEKFGGFRPVVFFGFLCL